VTAATTARQEVAGRPEPRHGLRVFLIWAVASAILTPIVYFVWGPHMPPGRMTDAAQGQQWDNTVLGTFATPVMILVYVWFGYAILVFRQRGPEIVDGVPLKGSRRLATAWILGTTAIVMFAFGFGTYELIVPAGAGGGEGPNPIWKPGTSKILEVQVIAQQWQFTYRWPQFGGVETRVLNLPEGQPVQFNVTSLDVIHDFWAYQLGVKADANPGINNVAYVTALHTGPFVVRCAELCGIWHGAMFDTGQVMPAGQFMTWITGQEQANAAVTKLLPPYSLVYEPSQNGAGGSYYADEPNSP
jgi:cytochrome c oxidase subunit 2